MASADAACAAGVCRQQSGPRRASSRIFCSRRLSRFVLRHRVSRLAVEGLGVSGVTIGEKVVSRRTEIRRRKMESRHQMLGHGRRPRGFRGIDRSTIGIFVAYTKFFRRTPSFCGRHPFQNPDLFEQVLLPASHPLVDRAGDHYDEELEGRGEH